MAVRLEADQHKTMFEPAESYYSQVIRYEDMLGPIDWAKTIWMLSFYPRSTVAFHVTISNDVERLLEWGVETFKKEYAVEAK